MTTDEDLEDLPEDEYKVGELEPRRLSWPYLAGVLVSALGNLGKTAMIACDEVAGELARHAEWARQADDAKTFASDVMRDLDAIPTAR